MIALFLLLFTGCRPQNQQNHPNIIIIMADDMGFSDIGCFGSEIATPNIDFLAENGVRITQMYTAARCCPTRASLLTGVYPHQAGMGDMVEGRMKLDNTLVPAYQGYLNDSLEMGILKEDAAFSQRYPEVPDWKNMSQGQRDTFELRMAVYAAMIYRMDAGIGQITEYLRETGELDNTFIVFLSDNGATKASIHLATSFYADRSGSIGSPNSFDSQGAGWANANNTPLQLFKTWPYEGGIATPFVAFWPEKIPSGIIDSVQVAHVIDFLPTCLDAAGIEPVNVLEGMSILPQLTGHASIDERTFYWEHQSGKAIRKGNWKLVMDKQADSKWELYNMNTDRTEMKDVIELHPHVAGELEKLWWEWANRIGVEPWDSLKLIRDL